MAKVKLRTRSATDMWLIGHPSQISGSKLPTNGQVLRYFYYIQSEPDNAGNPRNEALAYEVVDTVSVFWNMARIKTKARRNCMLQLMIIVDEYNQLCRSKHRDKDAGGKRAAFMEKLGQLYDIGRLIFIDVL